jgi:hypothetical protein
MAAVTVAEKIVVLAVKVSRSRLKHANLHVIEALAPDCICFLGHVKREWQKRMDGQTERQTEDEWTNKEGQTEKTDKTGRAREGKGWMYRQNDEWIDRKMNGLAKRDRQRNRWDRQSKRREGIDVQTEWQMDRQEDEWTKRERQKTDKTGRAREGKGWMYR